MAEPDKTLQVLTNFILKVVALRPRLSVSELEAPRDRIAVAQAASLCFGHDDLCTYHPRIADWANNRLT